MARLTCEAFAERGAITDQHIIKARAKAKGRHNVVKVDEFGEHEALWIGETNGSLASSLSGERDCREQGKCEQRVTHVKSVTQGS